MKLGLQLGYWGAQPNPCHVVLAQEAERLGFDSVWTAEAWGSDAFTPAAWIGAHTERIRLCTGIVQISARTPASCAMHTLTVDHLTGGRFTLGLGVSGPQVVEGWYGQPFGKPLARTREYIEVVRRILRREEPVAFQGEHFRMPYDGPGSWGLGKPLRSITHPLRADVPILLGAEGPKNVALAAEVADGWLPLYYSPFRPEVYADSLHAAANKPDFEISVNVMGCRIGDDIEEALLPTKAALAFYIGGMGARESKLPYGADEPDGLRSRGPQDPGPLLRRQARRGDPAGPYPVRGRDLARRLEGADPRPARRVEGEPGDDDHHQR